MKNLFQDGTSCAAAQDFCTVEESSRRARHTNPIRTVHDVDRIDPATAMNDDPGWGGCRAVRHENVGALVVNAPPSPEFRTRGTRNQCVRVSVANGDELGHNPVRRLTASKDAGVNRDQLPCCDHSSQRSFGATEFAELDSGDDSVVPAEPFVDGCAPCVHCSLPGFVVDLGGAADPNISGYVGDHRPRTLAEPWHGPPPMGGSAPPIWHGRPPLGGVGCRRSSNGGCNG